MSGLGKLSAHNTKMGRLSGSRPNEERKGGAVYKSIKIKPYPYVTSLINDI